MFNMILIFYGGAKKGGDKLPMVRMRRWETGVCINMR
jgi:hypothetical protein